MVKTGVTVILCLGEQAQVAESKSRKRPQGPWYSTLGPWLKGTGPTSRNSKTPLENARNGVQRGGSDAVRK